MGCLMRRGFVCFIKWIWSRNTFSQSLFYDGGIVRWVTHLFLHVVVLGTSIPDEILFKV